MNEVPQEWIDAANAAAQRTGEALDARSDELIEAVREGLKDGESYASAPNRLEKLLEALEFYADHDNWYGTYVASSKSAMYDDWGDPTDEWPDGKPGKLAREALNEYYGHN